MIALLALAAAGKAILYDTLDPDCFWHLRVAEALHRQGIGPLVDDLSFASIKTPWTPYSWLAELGMKALWDVGGYRLAVAAQALMQAGIVIVLAMIGCEAVKDRPGRQRYLAVALLTAFGTVLMLPYLSFRPATAAILLFGIILWLIVRDRQLEGGGPPPPRSTENRGVAGATPSRSAILEGGGPPPPFTHAASQERRPPVAGRAIWLAAPLAALLTNIHLYAVLAPIVCGLAMVGMMWHRQWPLARRYAMLTAACGVACLLTPMLKGTIQTAWFYQHSDAMVAGPIIAEMRPFLQGIGGKIYGTLILLAVAITWRNRKQLDSVNWLWLGLGLVLLLRLGRFAPLYTLLSMPALARGLNLLSDRALARPALRAALAGVLVIGCVRVGLAFPRSGINLDQWLNRHGPDTPGYPCAAAAFVESQVHLRTGHLINEFTWGGYLSWRLGDQYQVLLDGRTQLYSQKFWRQAYLGDPSQRIALIQQIQADAAVLPVGKSLFAPILLQNGWTAAYQDQRAQVLLPPAAAQVADTQ